MILLMVSIEIGVPLFCYYYYDWNYTETIFTLWTELIISIIYFYFKNTVHVFHHIYRLPQFKLKLTIFQKVYRMGFVLMFNIVIGFLIMFTLYYLFYISLTSKTNLSNSFTILKELFNEKVRDDALWFVKFNLIASVLNKFFPFIIYLKKNKWSNSKFYWIIPPEYIGNKHLFLAVLGIIMLTVVLVLYSIYSFNPVLLIYLFCLMHLYFAFVKIVFPVDKTIL